MFHHTFHLFCISYKVSRQVTTVELHTFNHVQFVLQTGTVFNGDNAFFTDFVHRFSDQFTYGFVGVSRDGTNLSNRFRVRARYGQRFQFFNWMSGLLWVLILTTLGYMLGKTPVFLKYEDQLMSCLMLLPVVLLVFGLAGSLVVLWKKKYGNRG